ncbi:DUF4352 domain-containing protein [Streptomyces flavochromogenes]|uniref:DUF4352 domain-containing protein n=1 Tax=Streptomyces flavochromogenes TaxID=68199 RepID=UPI00131A8A5C|nr:DUF4352 domain-containing protein [Streptomyces flavochromogenes]
MLAVVWTVLVAGVSSGITVAVVGNSDGVTAAPVVRPSIWQDTRTYPADPPQGPEAEPVPSPTVKGYAIGEKAKSSGATVVVKKVRESATVTLDDFETDKILKAGVGAKFAIVETTVYNDGTEPFDPVCGGGISQGLIDAEGRTFDLISDAYLVKANQKADACGEAMQPGFKRDAVFVYKIPADVRPAGWTFSGSRGMDEDDLAVVNLADSSMS